MSLFNGSSLTLSGSTNPNSHSTPTMRQASRMSVGTRGQWMSKSAQLFGLGLNAPDANMDNENGQSDSAAAGLAAIDAENGNSVSSPLPDLDGATTVSGSSLMSGQQHVVVDKPMSENELVDALTAVMTGQVEITEDDDDESSMASLSTISSRLELFSVCSSKTSRSARSQKNRLPSVPGSPSRESSEQDSKPIGLGQLFFYLEPNGSMRQLPNAAPSPAQTSTTAELSNMSQSGLEIQENIMMPSLLPAETNHESDVPPGEITFRASTPSPTPVVAVDAVETTQDVANSPAFSSAYSQVRDLIAKEAREADQEQLFERGAAMYRKGELLLAEGKIDEAREALEAAQAFQKHSIQLITQRMADAMHAQGLQHCDRGDKFLSVILLGVAEILKHRPTPGNIQFGANVHMGYRKVSPREEEFRVLRREADECVREIEHEALSMAETMRMFAKSIRMGLENTAKKAFKIAEEKSIYAS